MKNKTTKCCKKCFGKLNLLNCPNKYCPCHQPKEVIQFGQPNWGSHSIEVPIPSVESKEECDHRYLPTGNSLQCYICGKIKLPTPPENVSEKVDKEEWWIKEWRNSRNVVYTCGNDEYGSPIIDISAREKADEQFISKLLKKDREKR